MSNYCRCPRNPSSRENAIGITWTRKQRQKSLNNDLQSSKNGDGYFQLWLLMWNKTEMKKIINNMQRYSTCIITLVYNISGTDKTTSVLYSKV